MSDPAPAQALPPPVAAGPSPRQVALLFAASIVACLAAYLAFASARWYSPAHEQSFGGDRLTLSRGAGARSGADLVVARADGEGRAIVSVTTDFRAVDYAIVEWSAAGVPADAKVALLWRTDVEPARVNTRTLEVVGGRLVAADVHADAHWLGRITGLGLVFAGQLAQPVQVRGVAVGPGDAAGTLRDRVREWFAPEAFGGTSINTVVGGADDQPLPLPLLLACAIAVAAAAAFALHRRRGAPARIATAAIVLALAGWLVLDARWMANLTRQADATGRRYAGKDTHEKHLAADDAELYAFIEDVRRVLPERGARVFVVAQADYFRGRAAYHLYPANVWFDAYRDVLPPAERLRDGDWLVVYQRRGVQFDASRKRLRWDDVTVPAELKLLEHGGALFALTGPAAVADPRANPAAIK